MFVRIPISMKFSKNSIYFDPRNFPFSTLVIFTETCPINCSACVDFRELVFRHRSTREPKLPNLSAGIGISVGQVAKVCPVRTLRAYLDRSKDWDHGNQVWCCTRKQGGKYKLVTEKGCTLRRWMRQMMTRWASTRSGLAAPSAWQPAYIMQIGRRL